MMTKSSEGKWNIRWIIFSFFSKMMNNAGYLAWPTLFLWKPKAAGPWPAPSGSRNRDGSLFDEKCLPLEWKQPGMSVMLKLYPVSSLPFLPASSGTDAHPSLWKPTQPRVAVSSLDVHSFQMHGNKARLVCSFIYRITSDSARLCLSRLNQLPAPSRGHWAGEGGSNLWNWHVF